MVFHKPCSRYAIYRPDPTISVIPIQLTASGSVSNTKYPINAEKISIVYEYGDMTAAGANLNDDIMNPCPITASATMSAIFTFRDAGTGSQIRNINGVKANAPIIALCVISNK